MDVVYVMVMVLLMYAYNVQQPLLKKMVNVFQDAKWVNS